MTGKQVVQSFMFAFVSDR
jgi:PAS domain S-box-containing protein